MIRPSKPSQYFRNGFKMAELEQRIINLILEYKAIPKKFGGQHSSEERLMLIALFGPNWKVEIEQILNGVGY